MKHGRTPGDGRASVRVKPRDRRATDVLCAGPFPAIQRTLTFEQLRTGAVNRALRVDVSAAGKPVNAARAVRALGGRVRVSGFRGGETGRQLLRYLRAEHIPARFIDGGRPTRICQTLIDRSAGVAATELVEESEIPGPSAWADWYACMRRLLSEAAVLVLSGTLPKGAPTDAWAVLTRMASEHGVPVILDSHGEPLLRALPETPWLVKPNGAELAGTLSLRGVRQCDLRAGMTRLLEMGARHVLVTQGDGPALLDGECGAVRFSLPAVECQNPIGCGDTLAGVVAFRHARGDPLPEAVLTGLAAATARCVEPGPGAPNADAVAAWRPRISSHP